MSDQLLKKAIFLIGFTAIPGSESCYLKQAVPFEVRDWESKDVAIVRVMLQYLSNEVSAYRYIHIEAYNPTTIVNVVKHCSVC